MSTRPGRHSRLRSQTHPPTRGHAPHHTPAQAPPTRGHIWGGASRQTEAEPPPVPRLSHPAGQGGLPGPAPPSSSPGQGTGWTRPHSVPRLGAPGRVQASPCCRRLRGSPVVTPTPSQLRAKPAHRAQEPRRNGGGPQHLSTRVHTARPSPAPPSFPFSGAECGPGMCT